MTQRLHDDDLAGHMQAQEDWHKIVIPAVEDETWTSAVAATMCARPAS